MSHQQSYAISYSQISDDGIDSVREEKFGRRAPKPTHSSRTKRSKAPQSFNGMHRRRKRKVSW